MRRGCVCPTVSANRWEPIMRIRCPHCHNPLNVVGVEKVEEVSCPSCGSHFPLDDITVSYREAPVSRIAHFELLDNVGAGQFGSVYRAHDTRLQRVVAVKIPRTEECTAERRVLFLREALRRRRPRPSEYRACLRGG